MCVTQNHGARFKGTFGDCFISQPIWLHLYSLKNTSHRKIFCLIFNNIASQMHGNMDSVLFFPIYKKKIKCARRTRTIKENT